MAIDIWRFRGANPAQATSLDLTGFEVTGRDGTIGTVDKASTELSASYLIVDTGEWLPGRSVMLPAWTVERIDFKHRQVLVDRTRDEVREAPEYDRKHPGSARFQDRLTGYYHGLYDTGL